MMILAAMVTVLWMAWTACSRGSKAAIRVGWAIAVAAPTWMILDIGPARFDIRVVVFVTVCLIVAWKPSTLLNFGGLLWLDVIVVMLVILTNISQWYSGVFGPVSTFEALRDWIFPYVLGRLVASSATNCQELARVGAFVGIAVSMYCLLESVTHSNFLNDVVGRFGSPQGEVDFRFGLKRAEATFQHPISCGMAVAMLSPFVFNQALRSFRGEAEKFWMWGPLVSFLGVLGTISRGPITAWFVVMLLTTAFVIRPLRLPIVSLLILGAFAFFSLRTTAFEAIEDIEVRDSPLVINIHGESYEYTGTRHRLLQFLVYSPAINDAGWLGFGLWGSSPSHQLYIEANNRGLFKSIDNHYIVQLLNSGWLGLLLFLFLIIATVYYGLQLSIFERDVDRLFALSLVSVGFAVAILLNAVWFDYDFRYLWLCNSGIISGLWAQRCLSTKSSTIERNRRFGLDGNVSRPRRIATLVPATRRVFHYSKGV